MDVKERRALIEKYQEIWERYKEQNPELRFLEDALRVTAGYHPQYGDRPEQFPILCIPVIDFERPDSLEDWDNHQSDYYMWTCVEVVNQRDDLAAFGTDCGKIPDAYKIFSSPGVITFLAAFKIDCVFGCIRNDADVEMEHVGIPFGAIAFRADAKIGEAFAYFISQYGSSLRMGDCEHWCIFESE